MSYASVNRIAPHWLAGTMGHVHFTTDSQGSFAGPSTSQLGVNYVVSHGFVLGYRRRWDYFHTQCVNSSDQVPGRANFTNGTPSGFALGTYPTDRSNTTISFVVGTNTITSFYVTDGSPLTFTADIAPATGVWIGNGAYRLNSLNNTSVPAFSWPDTTETGLPWYHGSHTIGALVFHDVANTVRQFQTQLARVGNTANNASAGLLVSLGAATNGVLRTGWTADLADAGNYQVTAGGFYPNTHRLDLRIYTPNTAYDELNQAILPLTAVFARTNGSGVITSKADGTRLGFSCFSRPGASCADWLTYATQSQWQNVFSQIVIPGTRTRIVLAFILGHNVGAGEKTGDEYNATWVTNYTTLINRERNAALAAFPGAEIIPFVIIPWRCLEGGGVTTEVAARSIHARGVEVANAVGADWFSIPAAFDFQQLSYFLHPSTYGLSALIHGRMEESMRIAANSIQGGPVRSQIRVGVC